MPLLGYGVFKVDPKETERCVRDAISVGYRMIDTAQFYANEEQVGRAIAESGVAREDLFLITKVWMNHGDEEGVAKSIDESLRKLQTDYVDLLLVHHPYGDYYSIISGPSKTADIAQALVMGAQAARDVTVIIR